MVAQTSSISKNFLLGKTNYRVNSDFVKVKSEHSSRPVYLNKEAYAAFIEMFEAAKNEGIALKIVSGTRSFEEQKAIWEKKWENLCDLEPQERTAKILEFSSMPATSRHHWGTDVDLNNLENEYFESGKGKAEYKWLVSNANNFGFYQVYSSKVNGRTGYSEEKWHWSYVPLADIYLRFYNETIDYADISDFKGAELADDYQMITDYVNGISSILSSASALAILSAEESAMGQPKK